MYKRLYASAYTGMHFHGCLHFFLTNMFVQMLSEVSPDYVHKGGARTGASALASSTDAGELTRYARKLKKKLAQIDALEVPVLCACVRAFVWACVRFECACVRLCWRARVWLRVRACVFSFVRVWVWFSLSFLSLHYPVCAHIYKWLMLLLLSTFHLYILLLTRLGETHASGHFGAGKGECARPSRERIAAN